MAVLTGMVDGVGGVEGVGSLHPDTDEFDRRLSRRD